MAAPSQSIAGVDVRYGHGEEAEPKDEHEDVEHLHVLLAIKSFPAAQQIIHYMMPVLGASNGARVLHQSRAAHSCHSAHIFLR
jgi:hypothetical protein